MLLLERFQEESIFINTSDGRIEIKILGFCRMARKPKVRLGITAPQLVKINREEIQVKIDKGEKKP